MENKQRPIEMTELNETDTQQHMQDLGYGGVFGSGRDANYIKLYRRLKKTFGGK